MPLSLDAVFAALATDPLAESVQIVAAASLTPPQAFSPLLPFTSTRPLLVCGMEDKPGLQRVQATLLVAYPADHQVQLVAGPAVSAITLGALGAAQPAPDLCAYLAAQPVLSAVRSLDTLREITARLRAPDGCPWDRQQTHESLKPFVLEETYEVLEALDTGDRAELCEELGDLLMQVMIHSQIAMENSEFTLDEVLAGICSKLIRRHPHVFGDVQVSGTHDVLRNWQTIKQGEKKTNGDEPPPSLLGSVPVQLPALSYAQAMQERAGRLGFMRPPDDVASRAAAGIAAVQHAGSGQERQAAFGDLLFTVTQLGRWLGIDAEEALRLANRRYRERFMAVEAECRKRGLAMSNLDEDERQLLWHDTYEG